MPTARPRHSITETEDVAEALALAARRWSQDRSRPVKLLLRLIGEGRNVIEVDREAESARRRRSVEETAGTLTGSYRSVSAARLRAEWPE